MQRIIRFIKPITQNDALRAIENNDEKTFENALLNGKIDKNILIEK